MSRKRYQPRPVWWEGGIVDSDGEPSHPAKKQILAKDDSDDEYVPPGSCQALSKDNESENEFDDMGVVPDQDECYDRETTTAMDARSLRLKRRQARRLNVETDRTVNDETNREYQPQSTPEVEPHSIDNNHDEVSTWASQLLIPLSTFQSPASTQTAPSISNQEDSPCSMIRKLDESYEIADRIFRCERANVIQLGVEREDIEEKMDSLIERYELLTAESERSTARMKAFQKKRNDTHKAREEGLRALKEGTQRARDIYQATMEI